MAGPKPMRTKFGIHHRLDNCEHFLIFLQFVKHLMFQRKQVPSSIDAIRKDVEIKPSTAAAPDPQTTSGGSATLRGGPASAQEKLKRKRLADKQSRTRDKYLTRAKTFLDSYQALEDDICRHLDQVFGMLTSLRTYCKSIVQNTKLSLVQAFFTSLGRSGEGQSSETLSFFLEF